MRYILQVDPGGGQHRLTTDRALTMGRSTDNDIVLRSHLVSSHHAEIRIEPGEPVIRDLSSKNGKWVNSERIRDAQPLAEGDRIATGGCTILLLTEPDTSETQVRFLDEGTETQQIFAQIDTGETALVDPADRSLAFRALDVASRDLAVLHEMEGILLAAHDEDDLCESLLGLVFDVLPADRACVILRDEDGEPQLKQAKTRSGEGDSLAVSRTILNRTMNEGLSLLTSDAVADERFLAGDSIIIQGIRAAMCAPLRAKREVVGALYVDTRIQRGAFSKEDLKLLTTLGVQGGIAIENLRLRTENLKAARLAAIGGVVAGLSHDIRNILTALRGGAYVMEMVVGESEDADLHEAWDIVRHGTDTISVLVEDMVSYSKERSPAKDPTDLNDLVARVANRFAARADERGVKIDSQFGADLDAVPLEIPSLDRVLSNLLSNALDATGDDGGTVTVTTAREGDEAVVSIADTGCGIPPENRERIFDLLFSTKGSKGTGFGLAVTHKIITEHGGRVTVESEVGEGTVFHIALPCS